MAHQTRSSRRQRGVAWPPIPELARLPREAQFKVWQLRQRRSATAAERLTLTVATVVALFGILFVGMIPGMPRWAMAGLACVYIVGLLAWVTGDRRRYLHRMREALYAYCPGGRLPRCAMCDYDLRGADSDRCPECGTVVRLFEPDGRPREIQR